jgi:hypothetical protein
MFLKLAKRLLLALDPDASQPFCHSLGFAQPACAMCAARSRTSRSARGPLRPENSVIYAHLCLARKLHWGGSLFDQGGRSEGVVIMNHITQTLGFAFLGALASTSVVGCAGSATAEGSDESVAQTTAALSESVCPPVVPATLTPAAGQTLKEVFSGVGVQVYMCTAAANGAFTWLFVAPQANLLTDEGKLIGTHFIGPTWQGNDGSSVVGVKLAAATVDATAIPWLLLNGVSHSSDSGRFSDVTSIQRLSTVGGLAPTDGCDGTHIGSIAQVPYTAQYVFYKAKTHGEVKVCGG